MRLFAQTQLLEDVQGKGLCVGCGACVDLCPYLTNYRGKTAMLFPCDRETGRCFAFCPKAEVNYEELYPARTEKPFDGSALGPYREILKAKAGSKAPKGAFQCGGVVTALTACALENKLISAAVVTGSKGLMPAPHIVRTPEQVAACAGSKYAASPALMVMNQEAKRGVMEMGVVATPCQATAIAQMKTNPTGKEDFTDPVALVIGLFCTWAIDARELEALIASRVQGAVRSMDIPPPPAEKLVVETDQGVTEIPLSEIRPITPKGCAICPDMTSELADVSVGVVEGEPGFNTLIVRSEKGARLVELAVAQGYLETQALEAGKLEHLSMASGNKKKRALTEAGSQGILNTPEDKGRAAMRMPQAVADKILA